MRHFVTITQRQSDSNAWAALVFGAADLALNPLPECDTCDDTGTVEVFGPLGATYYPPCPSCRGPASEE
jgi:hypothetical protein